MAVVVVVVVVAAAAVECMWKMAIRQR